MLHLRSKLYSKRSKLEVGLQAYEKACSEASTLAIKVFFIIGLTLLMGACKKEGYIAPEEQPLYFEYHYMNHAWGLMDHGWLIDAAGIIRHFEFPESYHTVMHGDFLSLEQLEHNLGQADSVIGDVDVKEFEKRIKFFVFS